MIRYKTIQKRRRRRKRKNTC